MEKRNMKTFAKSTSNFGKVAENNKVCLSSGSF